MSYTPPDPYTFIVGDGYSPPDPLVFVVGGDGSVSYSSVQSVLEQSWACRMGQDLNQYWSDAPVRVSPLHQYYGDASLVCYGLLASYNDAPVVKLTMSAVWSLSATKSQALSVLYADAQVNTATLRQTWGDAQAVVNTMRQIWGDAGSLTLEFSQQWISPTEVSKSTEQAWNSFDAITFALQGQWAITGDMATATLSQLWDCKENNQAIAELSHRWSVATDGEFIRYRLAVTVNGQPVKVTSVNIESDIDQDAMFAEISLADEPSYLQCTQGAELVVEVVTQSSIKDELTETFHFRISDARISEKHGETRWIVEAMHRVAWLGSPWAEQIEGDYYGMASAIAQALTGTIPVTWSTVDWNIPQWALIASYETPLDLLKQIAGAVGAVVQSRPDGSIEIIPEYPVSVNQWGQSTPNLTIYETVDCVTTGAASSHRDGFNRFLVRDQIVPANSLRLEELDLDSTHKECRGYQVPWVGNFNLEHTGASHITIEYLGTEERVVEEVVEFVNGSGMTQYPIYGKVSAVWKYTNLGDITFSEDGTIESTTKRESLLALTYKTKCKLWRVTGEIGDQLQLVSYL